MSESPFVIFIRFQQIPQVYKQVFENGNFSVRFFFWRSNEPYFLFGHPIVILLEIISEKKKKYSTSSLISNTCLLLFIEGFC